MPAGLASQSLQRQERETTDANMDLILRPPCYLILHSLQIRLHPFPISVARDNKPVLRTIWQDIYLIVHSTHWGKIQRYAMEDPWFIDLLVVPPN